MSASKPKIWIGQYKYGARTIYAVTASRYRSECVALIKGGPFLDTVPRQWFLTPVKRRQRRKPT